MFRTLYALAAVIVASALVVPTVSQAAPSVHIAQSAR
jgi:hypothetical protein